MSSGTQRQCPRCRRKWSFGNLRKRWDLLHAYLKHDTTRAAGRRAAAAGTPTATVPTVLDWFGRFRNAVAAAHTDRFGEELRRRDGLLADPELSGLIGRQASAFRAARAPALGSEVLVVSGYVLFVEPAAAAAAGDALEASLGGRVERVGLGALFRSASGENEAPGVDHLRRRVRGAWRVPAGNRWAAVCEAAEWETTPTTRIRQMLFDALFDPDRPRPHRPS
ncbi:MAG: hypothetical protein U0804_02800 [Gemmataceae bacterium]